MSTNARNITFRGGIAPLQSYALGPIKTLDSTQPILDATPDESKILEPEAYVSGLCLVVQEKINAALAASPSETAQDVLETQLTILDDLKTKLTKYVSQDPHPNIHTYLKTLYEKYSDSRQAEALTLLLIKLMAEHSGVTCDDITNVKKGDIVVGTNMGLDVIPELVRIGVAGIVTGDARDSHLAVIALESGIPCLTELDIGSELSALKPGTLGAINGLKQKFVVHPDERKCEIYRERIASQNARKSDQLKHAIERCSTADGHAVILLENKNNFDFAGTAMYPFEGAGLVRTEAEIASLRAPIDHHTLRDKFKACACLGPDRPVTFRILDVNNHDKRAEDVLFSYQLSSAKGVGELEGIAFMLANPELLKIQYRAMIEASASHPINILIPFVKSADEVRQARALLEETYREFVEDPNSPVVSRIPPLYSMIETSESVQDMATLREIVAASDGISVGTNDLQHELCGTNRYEGGENKFQPKVIRALKMVSDVCLEQEKPVSMCGNLASDVEYIPITIGLRMTPVVLTSRVFDYRDGISAVKRSDCDLLLKCILDLDDAEKIERAVKEFNSPSDEGQNNKNQHDNL